MDGECTSELSTRHNASRFKLRQIVRLRHALHLWKKSAKQKSRGRRTAETPSISSRNGGASGSARVPPGHLAVYVGVEKQRFVIKTSLLYHPLFKALLRKAEKEMGFDYKGGLSIPCEAGEFRRLLLLMERKDVVEKGTANRLKVLPLHDNKKPHALIATQESHSDRCQTDRFHGLLKELMRLYVAEISSYLTPRCDADVRLSVASSDRDIVQQAICG
ncbi:hypothetical protein KP509_32G072700 [Ceratopteris richardii]|uniref:Uncharacterized protein n=1 Tax=Ceratopteris richardii TaxID=49495 RepID=A0A8T2QW62_CERRI|nr:hypothetical protein KP509_32G072700 [Ceratopteris richardii]